MRFKKKIINLGQFLMVLCRKTKFAFLAFFNFKIYQNNQVDSSCQTLHYLFVKLQLEKGENFKEIER